MKKFFAWACLLPLSINFVFCSFYIFSFIQQHKASWTPIEILEANTLNFFIISIFVVSPLYLWNRWR